MFVLVLKGLSDEGSTLLLKLDSSDSHLLLVFCLIILPQSDKLTPLFDSLFEKGKRRSFRYHRRVLTHIGLLLIWVVGVMDDLRRPHCLLALVPLKNALDLSGLQLLHLSCSRRTHEISLSHCPSDWHVMVLPRVTLILNVKHKFYLYTILIVVWLLSVVLNSFCLMTNPSACPGSGPLHKREAMITVIWSSHIIKNSAVYLLFSWLNGCC